MSIKNLLANVCAINVHMKIIDPLVSIQIESIKFIILMEHGQEDVNVEYVMNSQFF